MPYCRFHNTLSDLLDANDYLDGGKAPSDAEAKARERLIKLCVEIALNYGASVGQEVELID